MIKSKKTTLFLIIIYCSIHNLVFRSAFADNNQDTIHNAAPGNTTEGLLATTEQMIEQLILQIDRSRKVKKVSIGMSKEHVLLSWGKPRNINKSIGGWGVHEQWVYPNRYLYFENGILTSIQTSD